MSDGEIRAPRCPGCDELPMFAMSEQYWCGNADCEAMVWDPTEDPAAFKARAVRVELIYPEEL